MCADALTRPVSGEVLLMMLDGARSGTNPTTGAGHSFPSAMNSLTGARRSRSSSLSGEGQRTRKRSKSTEENGEEGGKEEGKKKKRATFSNRVTLILPSWN
ncbi:unnamed protein product [Amoebophrya sp. A25]|nr:unnamed protein product [Amoebophrya sp. A25]|eukprot:GSA25T00011206001.1